jgi:hypothetical protein
MAFGYGIDLLFHLLKKKKQVDTQHIRESTDLPTEH